MSWCKKKICFSLLLAAGLLILALMCTLISEIDFSSDDASILFSDSSTGENETDKAFEAYTEDLFRQEVSANGLTLHYTLDDPAAYDITSYNTDLGSFSAESLDVSAALSENISAALEEFNVENLSTENRFTLEILKDTLAGSMTAASFPYYEEPLRPSTGEQAQLPILLAEYTFSDTRDIGDYLEILSSVSSCFESICAYEREKLDYGLFMSDAAAETVISQCRDFAASVDNNYLLYTFDAKVDALDESLLFMESAAGSRIRAVAENRKETASRAERSTFGRNLTICRQC